MVKCCVIGCTTRYKTKKVKLSMFKSPNGSEGLKMELSYSKKNFVLSSAKIVSEKNICESDIIRFWESGSGASLIKV